MTHCYSLHLNTVNRIKKVFGHASNDYMLKTPVLRVNMFCYMKCRAAIVYIILFVVHKKKKSPGCVDERHLPETSSLDSDGFVHVQKDTRGTLGDLIVFFSALYHKSMIYWVYFHIYSQDFSFIAQ